MHLQKHTAFGGAYHLRKFKEQNAFCDTVTEKMHKFEYNMNITGGII